MDAKFRLKGLNQPVLVVTPETDEERILLAAFLRFDSNALSFSVERFDNGLIDTITISASEMQ